MYNYLHTVIPSIFSRASNVQERTNYYSQTIIAIFHSAYKAHHSTETTLLRVYNDVMFNIDRGNGALLVLLDLSVAFDTIDHQILFHILEHSLGITDSALALKQSYLDGRQQCVQIEG